MTKCREEGHGSDKMLRRRAKKWGSGCRARTASGGRQVVTASCNGSCLVIVAERGHGRVNRGAADKKLRKSVAVVDEEPIGGVLVRDEDIEQPVCGAQVWEPKGSDPNSTVSTAAEGSRRECTAHRAKAAEFRR